MFMWSNKRSGLVGITAALLLSGCYGSSTDSTSGAVPAGNGAPVTASNNAGDIQVIPDMGKDFTGIRKDVKLESCSLTKGKVAAKGTVKNTSDSAKDVVVAIAWMSKDMSQTQALKVAAVKALPAGESRDFDLAATLPAAAEICAVQAKANKVGTLK